MLRRQLSNNQVATVAPGVFDPLKSLNSLYAECCAMLCVFVQLRTLPVAVVPVPCLCRRDPPVCSADDVRVIVTPAES